MRKFLTLASILITISAVSIAQMHYSPPIPHPMNMNKPNYVYNTGTGWLKGSYTDVQGTQHAGFIMDNVDKSKMHVLDYKKERSGKKTSIPIDSVAFVIFSANNDTFVVSRSPILNDEFIRPVVITNKLKLYNQPVIAGFSIYGVKDVWYYGTNKDDLTLLDKKNFFDIMPQIMADKPDVVKNILNKQYRYGDMVDLITYYQTGREPWRDRDNEQ